MIGIRFHRRGGQGAVIKTIVLSAAKTLTLEIRTPRNRVKTIENAFEGLKGDGVNTFGTADLLGPKGVNSNVGLQLDTGNFFCVSRGQNSPSDVKAFFEENVKRMGYTHLKTSIDKKAGQVLNGNEVPFETFFTSLAKNDKVYVAFELANADTLENTKINHQKSIDYLLKNL